MTDATISHQPCTVQDPIRATGISRSDSPGMILAILACVGPFSFAFSWYKCQHLLPLFQNERHVKLDFSPNELSGLDVTIVLAVLLLRSILQSIRSIWKPPRKPDMKSVSLTMPLRTTTHDLGAYAEAVGTTANNDQLWNGPLLLLYLSALTEPAMLLLLAHRYCSVRPLGSVNVRNRLELLRPDLCDARNLDSLRGGYVHASLSENIRTVKRGYEVDLQVNLDVPSDRPGESITIFRQNFTILQSAKVQPNPLSKPLDPGDATEPNWSQPSSFAIQSNDPASWARICKDYNPIHTSTLAAKAFGFPGKLAHGNHIVAKAMLAAHDIPNSAGPLWMEVSFKRPVIVPAQLDIIVETSTSERDGSSFQVLRKSKVCIEGKVGSFK